MVATAATFAPMTSTSSAWVRRAFGALLVATSGATVFAACVGDDPGPAPIGEADASASPEASSPDGDGGGDLCATYCAEIARACTGPNRQYRDDQECMRACALLPQGTEDDGARNSVGCRLRQARAATSLESCIVAGPFGGGTCGTRCEAFCDVVMGNCVELAPFGSRSTCLEECPKFVFDPNEGEGPDQKSDGNDTINCRSHHAILALDDKVVHCPHTGTASPVCLIRDAGHDH